MKNRFIIGFLISFPFCVYGQGLKVLEITFSKSTHVYFPSEIEYVDVGVPDDIGWQKMGNMVKLTAFIEGFEYESNLTVHTVKGIYMFNIQYNMDLQRPIFFIEEVDMLKRFDGKVIEQKGMEVMPKVLATNTDLNKKKDEQSTNKRFVNNAIEIKKVEKLCTAVLKKTPTIGDVGSYKHKVFAVVTGIYAAGDQIFMKLEMKNDSALDFDISYQNFYTKAKKNLKKSVIAPEEIKPVFVMNAENREVPANGGIVKMVIVFDKFFVDENKRLFCEIGEDEARFIKFQINAKHIINAKAI